MDFSDSFFQDRFRCEGAVNIPEKVIKSEPPSLAELVPTGLSPLDSSEWVDKFAAAKFDSGLTSSLSPELSVNFAATRDAHNFSPSLFIPNDMSSFADLGASQPSFFLEVGNSEYEVEIPATDTSIQEEEPMDEKHGLPLTYFGVEESRKSMASAVAAAATAATKVDQSFNSCDVGEESHGSTLVNVHCPTPGTESSKKTLRGATALSRKTQSDFESPDGFKLYRMRRERNNEASRRSRTKFRQKAREMEEEVQDLRQQNDDLRRKLLEVTANMEELQSRLNRGTSPLV